MRWLAAALVAAMIMASGPAEAARKALVIGNAAYPTQRLANPVNDATDVAAQLKALGYEVTLATDATRTRMTRAVLDFRRGLAAGDEAVVFYAGHGMQVRGANWLIPVDADPREEAEVEAVAVGLDWLLRNISEAGARTTLVLLDACRNNPFESRFRGGTRGLARVEAAASGTLVSYAARPGTVADDGRARNSPYTAAWLAALAEPGLTHHRILDRVHLAVKQSTADRQETWQEGQLTGELVLNRAAPAAAGAPVPAFDPRLVELRFWESTERGGTRADYEAYLSRYPDGEFVGLAKARVAAASAGPSPIAAAPAPVLSSPVPASPSAGDDCAQCRYLHMDLPRGRVVIEMLSDVAPRHVARIRELAAQGFYDGIAFHRVIDGYIAQGGDPEGTGRGGTGTTIAAEPSSLKHVRGMVSMARGPGYDSADSQFFIMLGDAPYLDTGYTIWGRVIAGMSFVDALKRGEGHADPDRILRMRPAERPQ